MAGSARRCALAVTVTAMVGCAGGYRRVALPEAATEKPVPLRLQFLRTTDATATGFGVLFDVVSPDEASVVAVAWAPATATPCSGGSPVYKLSVDGARSALPAPLNGARQMQVDLVRDDDLLQKESALDFLIAGASGTRTCARWAMTAGGDLWRNASRWDLGGRVQALVPLRAASDELDGVQVEGRLGLWLGARALVALSMAAQWPACAGGCAPRGARFGLTMGPTLEFGFLPLGPVVVAADAGYLLAVVSGDSVTATSPNAGTVLLHGPRAGLIVYWCGADWPGFPPAYRRSGFGVSISTAFLKNPDHGGEGWTPTLLLGLASRMDW